MEKREPSYTVDGNVLNKLVAATMENSLKFKLFLKYDSIVLFLNIDPGEMKISVHMNIYIY